MNIQKLIDQLTAFRDKYGSDIEVYHTGYYGKYGQRFVRDDPYLDYCKEIKEIHIKDSYHLKMREALNARLTVG